MSLPRESADEKKEVSIVIPTYNRGGLLEQVLKALSEQTFPLESFEVLVVVDGSTDETKEMLQAIQLPYKIRVFYRQQGGVAATRNFGANMATGDIIVFIDDDVIPSPQLVAEYMRFHYQDDKIVVLGRLLPDARARWQGWNRWEEALREKHYRAMLDGRRPPAGRRLYSGNFSVSKQNFLLSGGFDEKLKRAEDIDLGYRLEAQGMHFQFNPAATATHCGYRSFNSWCRMACQYGQCDVIMARDKGYSGMLANIFGWYHGRNALIRLLTRVCLRQRYLTRAAVQFLRTVATISNISRLEAISRYAYSGTYNLLYWRGVADELGSIESFWHHVEKFRPTAPE